ncbi:MAG TPA: hypothetical protein VNT99_03495 [Methylomirabilota bacterium]|nr:hypothetical protein [Methylomirabilota bacterium]
MSAINDALRRASSAAKTPMAALPPQPVLPSMNMPPPSSSAPVPPPPAPAPVAPPPIIAALDAPLPPLRIDTSKKRSKLPFVLALLLLCCIGGAAALYLFGKDRLVAQAREKMQQQQESMDGDPTAILFGDPKAMGQIANQSVRSNQVSAKLEPSVAPVAPEPAPKVAPVAPTPKPAPVSTAASRTPAQFPPLRLQSIFYRPSSPSVMINGKTLYVTDEINGVLVADIQPSSVTLVLSGQTNVLTLR